MTTWPFQMYIPESAAPTHLCNFQQLQAVRRRHQESACHLPSASESRIWNKNSYVKPPLPDN